MEIGDLIQYQDQRWMVTSYDREARLMTLFNLAGTKIELPREFDRTNKDKLQVVASPSKQWPMMVAQVKSSSAGPFVKLAIPAPMGREGERVLEPWVDWVPSDFSRSGGSFFVHPELRLLPGMILLATHQKGTVVRVTVPKTYGTVAHRKALSTARAAAPSVAEPNRFSRLLQDDDDEM